MSGITLFTSGSTSEPKKVFHSWEYIKQCALRSAQEIGLTPNDRVLDVFPANTIAHYTVTAYPSIISGAHLVSANFNPYSYIELFKEVQPTYISLIPRHLELLKSTKGFKDLDMNCVRYMVAGSGKITQEFIDTFRERGVQIVANWYGMTEAPPPVMIGYNSTSFDLSTVPEDYKVTFETVIDSVEPLVECYINNNPTGDYFNIETLEFVARNKSASNKTWKNAF